MADFSERERLVLDLVRPHLAQSYRNAEAVAAIERGARLADCALEQLQHGVIVVSREGRVVRTSPTGGDGSRSTSRAPDTSQAGGPSSSCDGGGGTTPWRAR